MVWKRLHLSFFDISGAGAGPVFPLTGTETTVLPVGSCFLLTCVMYPGLGAAFVTPSPPCAWWPSLLISNMAPQPLEGSFTITLLMLHLVSETTPQSKTRMSHYPKFRKKVHWQKPWAGGWGGCPVSLRAGKTWGQPETRDDSPSISPSFCKMIIA